MALFTATSNKNSLGLALLIAAALLLLNFLSFLLWQSYPEIVKENGLLEDGQVLFLLIACIAAALRFNRVRSTASFDKELLLALMFSSLVILLREVDIDKLGSSAIWPLVEKAARAIAAVALLGFIVHLLRKCKSLARNFGSLLKTPVTIMVLLGAVLYMCSWPLDKNLIAIDVGFSQLLEEIVELNACILLALAAFACGVKQELPQL